MSVIKTKKITNLFNYVDDETLVIFDVDNTLITPVGHVGSVAWFKYQHARMVAEGKDEKESVALLAKIWGAMQGVIAVKTVETCTSGVVKELHSQNIKTMGLTGRGFHLADVTIKQLDSAGIDLSKQTIHDEDVVLDEKTGFVGGVLSVEPWFGHKGDAFKKLCEKINYEPKKILFIDDEPDYMDQMKSTFKDSEIEFTGICYEALSDHLEKFQPAKADQELIKLFVGTKHEKLLKGL